MTEVDDGLSPDERLNLLRRWNDRTVPSATTTVPQAFDRQARLTPDALALVAGETRLTYGELAARVNQLANRLRDAGIDHEQMVAIALPRSAEMVVAVLAVLAAGGAFVPVDPSWPVERRRQVSTETRCVVTLVAPGGETPADPDPLAIELGDWAFGGLSTNPPRTVIDGSQLAYVIFTSGSTGRPKGAMIRHEAIGERLTWQVEEILGFGQGDASLFKAPLAFDISINEILLPLVSGGYVVVAEPGGERDPQYLLELITREKVTFVYLVSSMLDVLLALAAESGPDTNPLAGLKHVWCGGEVLTPALFDRFRSQLSTTLYHGYGPAEATIGVSHVIYRDRAERIETSIGRPNPHTQLYVLDDDLRPAPVGVGGELYAAGFLLGRGYIQAPGMTGSRFVANPFDDDGSRMYRTGDLARWTPDGALEFLGRADNQVKIRGMRVELEEIEVALAAHPMVRQAAVTVRQGSAGGARLTGYVVSTSDVDDAELRRWCASRLPEHMVPDTVLVLDRFPVTANGKIDRRALPEPAVPVADDSPLSSDPLVVAVCETFAELLGVPSVGPDADFFALGGDSIVAMGLISRARKLGLRLRPRDVFSLRTPNALATAIAETRTGASTIEKVDAVGEIGATPILAWLAEVGNGTDGFFQSITLHTPGELTLPVLTSMIDALLTSHDVLRARLEGDDPTGLVVPPDGSVTAADVVARVPLAGDVDQVTAEQRSLAVGRLDAAAGAMVQAVWLDAGEGRPGRLILVVHHIVVDGVSLRLLADDLRAWWSTLAQELAITPAPAETSFREWSTRLRDSVIDGAFADDEDHWLRVAARDAVDDPLLGSRALDPSIDVVATEAKLVVRLDDDVTARLLGPVPAAIRGRVNDVLVAALALALAKWRDADTSGLVLELEGHGREADHLGSAGDELDLARTVGWFTTLFPVYVDPGTAPWDELMAGGPELGAAVKVVKEQLRAVPRNGLSYGALRYLSGRPRPDLAVAPQLLFNYLGRFAGGSDEAWSLADATVSEDRCPRMPLPRALEVNAITVETDRGAGLEASFSWPSGVLTDDRVRELAALWREACGAIAGATALSGPTPSDFPLVAVTQADLDALPDVERVDLLPPSPLQTGIYFHSTYADVDPYVVQQIVDLTGPVDPARLRVAANLLTSRHPNLGAAFRAADDGSIFAIVDQEADLPWTCTDLGALDDDAARHRITELAEQQREQPFDLSEPPLMRYALARLDSERHVLIQTVHHIVADGWSVPIVLRELLTLHDDPAVALPAAPPYRAYLQWVIGAHSESSLAAWREELAGVDEPTRLADALPLNRSRETGFGRVGTRLPAELSAGIADWAGRRGVTASSVLGAAWGIAVGRLTGRTDVVFGSTVSGRSADVPEIEHMVGLLINTVAARTRWDDGDSLATVVDRYAAAQAGLFEHHHVALSDVQRAIGVPELFDTLLVIENHPDADDPRNSIRVESMAVVEAPHYPLTLMVEPSRLTVALTHDRARVDTDTAERVLALYGRILDAIVDRDETRCCDIEVLTVDEYDALLAAGTGAPGHRGTVVDLISDRVQSTPHAVALVDGVGELTYADLDERAGRLAGALVHAGVRRGDVVAVATGRTSAMAVALLAVLRSGAAYLPVDPQYPAARITLMLDDARPRVVLTDGTELPPHDVPTVSVDAATDLVACALIGPDDAASIVYTSGSTGHPKGTVGTHGALVNRLTWAVASWSHQQRDVRIAKSSMSFIDGTTELLGAIVAGATTVIADDDVAKDGARLATLVEEVAATQVLVVPSLASAMAEVAPWRLGSVPAVDLQWGGIDRRDRRSAATSLAECRDHQLLRLLGDGR